MHLTDWLSVSVRVVVLSCLFPTLASAQPQVWSGLTKSFTKAAFADPGLPQNQDHITPNVAITRGSTGGIYNAILESSYTTQDANAVEPSDTGWATDVNNPGKTISAANWEDLEFDTWLNAYGGLGAAGFNVEDRDAVVYLLTDDIVLDLRFTDWGQHFGGGGSFSYLRAEVPEPTTIALLTAGALALLAGRRRSRR